jgi:hypothetical protein
VDSSFKILMLAILLITYSCGNNRTEFIVATDQIKDRLQSETDTVITAKLKEQYKPLVVVKGDTTIIGHEISSGEYTMKVVTVSLNDSVTIEPKFNPVILSQTLKFYKNGALIKETKSIAKSNVRVLSSNKKMNILENVIYKIGNIQGEKGSIYTVTGTGACNACNELNVLYSLDGEVKFCFYGSTRKTIISISDPEKVYKEYGIDGNSKVSILDLKIIKYFF